MKAIEAPKPRAREDSTTSADNPRPSGRHSRSTSQSYYPPRKTLKTEKDNKTGELKVRAPDFSEWHTYLGDFVIKWTCRGYIAYVFRGLERDLLLTKVENDALEPDKEMLASMAKPFAHMASRSKLGEKYGRVIIDSSESIEAVIAFGMWAARANRIANRYNGKHRKVDISEQSSRANVSTESESAGVSGPAYVSPNGHSPGFGYN
jgi:hypothetical protein